MSAEARRQFIEQYTPNAMAAFNINNKILPETILTVSILESTGEYNWDWVPGKSKLAVDGNNFFGIKDSSDWNGDTITLETHEEIKNPLYPPVLPERILMPVNATFRKYPTIQASFNDFVKLMADNSRFAGVLSATTPYQQFQALQGAGYATNSQYAALLNTIYTTLKATFDKYLKGVTSGSASSVLKPVLIIAGLLFGAKYVFSQSK